ncbi:hypothetical protein, partial [Dickeya zeae]|uniref:hypothetical protein n=1 Tax=Dickeya zeae TaxID=204042 RepID=UPI00209807F6
LTPRCVAAVAVSVEAHYRELFRPDKRNFHKKNATAHLLTKNVIKRMFIKQIDDKKPESQH